MTINQYAAGAPLALPRRLLTPAGAIGVGFSLTWIVGLAVPAPDPALHATGGQIAAAMTARQASFTVQSVLVEGLATVGLIVAGIVLARAARRDGATASGRVVLLASLVAAISSFAQVGLGLVLIKTAAPDTAHALWGAINRLDGVKLLALGVFGLAAARGAAAALPRWLRGAGLALAVTITISGVGFLLLNSEVALTAAAPALALLLVFVTGSCLALGATRKAER